MDKLTFKLHSTQSVKTNIEQVSNGQKPIRKILCPWWPTNGHDTESLKWVPACKVPLAGTDFKPQFSFISKSFLFQPNQPHFRIIFFLISCFLSFDGFDGWKWIVFSIWWVEQSWMLSDRLTYADSSNRFVKYDHRQGLFRKGRGDHPSLSSWGPNSYKYIQYAFQTSLCVIYHSLSYFLRLQPHRSHNFILHMLQAPAQTELGCVIRHSGQLVCLQMVLGRQSVGIYSWG